MVLAVAGLVLPVHHMRDFIRHQRRSVCAAVRLLLFRPHPGHRPFHAEGGRRGAVLRAVPGGHGAVGWWACWSREYPSPGLRCFSCAGPILYVGIFSSGVAYTLQILAQKDSNPTVVSLLLSLESVFATLAGALLLA